MSSKAWVLGFGLVAGGLAALAGARGDEAVVAEPASLDGAIDAAIGRLEGALPAARPCRIAVLPVVGPGKAETGLGRRVAARVRARLGGRGIEVIGPEAIRPEDRQRLGGPLGAPDEALARLLAHAVVYGRIEDGGGGYELSLELLEGNAGKVKRVETARLPRDSAAGALAVAATGAPAAEPSGAGAPTAGPSGAGATGGIATLTAPGLAIERALLIERQERGGKYEEPALWDGSEAATGDRIQLQILPREDCFISVICVQADKSLIVVYPSGGTGPAKVKAGELVCVPEVDDEGHASAADLWFRLEASPGHESPGGGYTETLYLIAERDGAKIASIVEQTRKLGELREEIEEIKQKAERLADAREKAALEARRKEIWEDEERRAATQRAELQFGAQAFLADFQLRNAFGAPPAAGGVRERNLSRPEKGQTVTVKWSSGAGETPMALERVEGTRGILEQFVIRHR